MGAGLLVLTAIAVSPSIVSIWVVTTTISLSVCGGYGVRMGMGAGLVVLGWGQVRWCQQL